MWAGIRPRLSGGAIERETDTIYLYSEYYRGQVEPVVHAQAIRSRGAWIMGAVDPASRGRGQHDGQQLFQNYIDLGLSLTPADNGVESGIMDVLSRLSTGRLKLFDTLQNTLAEIRLYRRDEKGRVVKEFDHLMDALRYLVVMLPKISSTDPNYLARLRKLHREEKYDPHAL